jgi:hypothetical protein
MAAMQTAHRRHEDDGRACPPPMPGEPLHGGDCFDDPHRETLGENPRAGNPIFH